VSPRDIFPVFLVPQKAYNCTTLLLFLIKVKYLFTLISRYVITVDIKCRLLLKLIYETCPISVNATITTDITLKNGTLNGPSDFPYFTKYCVSLHNFVIKLDKGLFTSIQFFLTLLLTFVAMSASTVVDY
jgi:hypothetical protein